MDVATVRTVEWTVRAATLELSALLAADVDVAPADRRSALAVAYWLDGLAASLAATALEIDRLSLPEIVAVAEWLQCVATVADGRYSADVADVRGLWLDLAEVRLRSQTEAR